MIERIIGPAEVKAGGDIIARYMGAKTAEDRKEGIIYNLPDTACYRTWYELKYDQLWDRLIPVWAKLVAEMQQKKTGDDAIRLFNYCVGKDDVIGAFQVVVFHIQELTKHV